MAPPKKPFGAIPPDIQEHLDAVDTGLDEIGAELTQLRNDVKEGMNAADVSNLRNRVTGLSAKAKALKLQPPEPTP